MHLACPYCGSTDSYSFNDYGWVHEYTGIFGGGRSEEEVNYTGNKRKPPIYAKCDNCGKRISLKELR